MPTVFRTERLFTPDDHGAGWVLVEGGRILDVGTGRRPPAASHVVELGDRLLTPGFVDLHAHGGGGASYADGASAARVVLATHRAHGTTSAMASLVSDDIPTLAGQVCDLAPLVRADELVGIHLEGPWLSARYSGAHDPSVLGDPAPADVESLLVAGRGTVRMVTLAPERLGGPAAIVQLVAAGVLVGVGHTDATYRQTVEAIDAGVRVGTHLFNAERPVHHREPGPVAALLERPEVVVELVADGVHLHPTIVRDVARLAPGRFALVTDAMAAAGAGDGTYRLGPLEVEVHDGVARVAGTDTVAGSTLTLDRAIRYGVEQAGLDLAVAIRAATLTPATVLGRHDIGRLAPGAYADLVVLDGSLQVEGVYRRGRPRP